MKKMETQIYIFCFVNLYHGLNTARLSNYTIKKKLLRNVSEISSLTISELKGVERNWDFQERVFLMRKNSINMEEHIGF